MRYSLCSDLQNNGGGKQGAPLGEPISKKELKVEVGVKLDLFAFVNLRWSFYCPTRQCSATCWWVQGLLHLSQVGSPLRELGLSPVGCGGMSGSSSSLAHIDQDKWEGAGYLSVSNRVGMSARVVLCLRLIYETHNLFGATDESGNCPGERAGGGLVGIREAASPRRCEVSDGASCAV